MGGSLTANELIAALQGLTDKEKELPVFTEGCDCWGPSNGIDPDQRFFGEKIVLIKRCT